MNDDETKTMIPSFGTSLAKDAGLSNQVISRTTRVLQLSEEGSASQLSATFAPFLHRTKKV